MNDYWLKQDPEKPLFPDIIWSRPENRNTAGKILIVGGNLHSFSAVSTAYSSALKAGVGTARVLLPDSLKKTVGNILENCEFAPSNTSGSFSKEALNEILIQAMWADALLLAGDFGKSSETTLMLESLLLKYRGILCMTGDAMDHFLNSPTSITENPNICLVGNFSQMQKLLMASGSTSALGNNMELSLLVQNLHSFTLKHQVSLITVFHEKIIVTSAGKVSTTPHDTTSSSMQTIASRASVFWLQNPKQPFEALTASVV